MKRNGREKIYTVYFGIKSQLFYVHTSTLKNCKIKLLTSGLRNIYMQ